MSPTDFGAFEKNFNAGRTQLVSQWLAADTETPVSAYLKLCGGAPYSFLLESVEGGATLGRYSIIGHSPDMKWSAGKDHEKTLASLRQALADCRIDDPPADLPPMAVSGLFGYLGYDMIRLIENIPDKNPDNLGIPESILTRPTVLAIFDNVKNMICIVAPVYEHANNSKKTANDVYKQASARLAAQIENLEKSGEAARASSSLSVPLAVKSNMDAAGYKNAVTKAIDYIRQGEIFQAVLSQRFTTDFDLPPFELYRSLRRLNPSPFMFHLQFEDFALVGSSPEVLVRVRDNTVTIRPIAGTRKRGTTEKEDKFLAEDLLADPKERSEHLMLLDLGRNDVGRVSDFGTVKVTSQFKIENYSHVMHIVSNVEGRLKKDYDIVDALFAGFPAGTVSGAPKVRAMEIIDELEPSRRSYYAGGVGYFSGNGEMDTCIALRTALVKDGKLHVQAGAGIVADSNPDSEHQETVNKAQAVIRAAELAVEQAQNRPRRAGSK
ncbi:MAG: anthranilate synthase component I [Alphaproteobacteria bacterium PRO2]|nr:anthranilate synthase component I [Alphaproteobacteria bacterium PRO2]